MGDHVSTMESHFARLSTMGTHLEEGLKVAILLFSLSGWYGFAPKMASVHTLHDSIAT